MIYTLTANDYIASSFQNQKCITLDKTNEDDDTLENMSLGNIFH